MTHMEQVEFINEFLRLIKPFVKYSTTGSFDGHKLSYFWFKESVGKGYGLCLGTNPLGIAGFKYDSELNFFGPDQFLEMNEPEIVNFLIFNLETFRKLSILDYLCKDSSLDSEIR